MVPIFGLLIPIISIGGFFAWMISISPVGKAYAERVRGQHRGGSDEDHEELLQALDDLRRDVSQLAERVDFTERMLAKRADAERLAPPARERA
jgi:hypothetical protein